MLYPLIIPRLLIVSIMNQDLMAFFARNNVPRIKYGAYVINLDDKNSKRTHWFHYLLTVMQYFDSFGMNVFLKKY